MELEQFMEREIENAKKDAEAHIRNLKPIEEGGTWGDAMMAQDCEDYASRLQHCLDEWRKYHATGLC